MTHLKVIGAGSAGMHLAHAGRSLGWDVDIVDTDPAALKRLPTVFVARYGNCWDTTAVGLYRSGDEPHCGYDVIAIATPPRTHVALALEALKEDPRALLVEKPLCAPDQVEEAQALLGTQTYVGYTHILSAKGKAVTEAAGSLDVEFREHWDGPLGAHPWLTKPEDSYIGYWREGGGATSEHSHGINMWQHLARDMHGEVVRISAYMNYEDDYDSLSSMRLETDDGFGGYAIQDTTSKPTVKRATIVGLDNRTCAINFDKCNFKAELAHIISVPKNSPISVKHGWSTARLIAAAHASAQGGYPVCLDASP